MKIIGQLVGGPCDGVEIDVDPSDDYPDTVEASGTDHDEVITYYRRPIKGMLVNKPNAIKKGIGYIYFDDQEADE